MGMNELHAASARTRGSILATSVSVMLAATQLPATDVEVLARHRVGSGRDAYVLHVPDGATVQAEDLSLLLDAAAHGRGINGQKFGDLTVKWASATRSASPEPSRRSEPTITKKSPGKTTLPAPASRRAAPEPEAKPAPPQKPDFLLVEPPKPEKPDIIIVEPGAHPSKRDDNPPSAPKKE